MYICTLYDTTLSFLALHVLSTLFYVADILLRIKWFSKLFPSISYKFSFYLRTYYQYNYIMYLCTQHNKIPIRYPINYKFNPLWTKLFFSSFFGTYPKIGSFRLPTHMRYAHKKFFDDSFLKWN